MNEFLTFRRMILPVIIQVVWWIGNLAIVFTFFGSWAALNEVVGGLSFPVSILVAVVSFFWWRCLCEFLMIVFRINETLSDIRRELREKE